MVALLSLFSSLLESRRMGDGKRDKQKPMSIGKGSSLLQASTSTSGKGYFSLSKANLWELLLTLAQEYDLHRKQVRELMKQCLGLKLSIESIFSCKTDLQKMSNKGTADSSYHAMLQDSYVDSKYGFEESKVSESISDEYLNKYY